MRETDLSPSLAAERYRQFKEQVYESLKLVKSSFHFHFINGQHPNEFGGTTHSCADLSTATSVADVPVSVLLRVHVCV